MQISVEHSLPEPRQNLTIRMRPSLKEALLIRAAQERRNLSDLLEEASRLYLAQQSTAA